MENSRPVPGRVIAVSFISGIIAFVLLVTSASIPGQLVFESKPYARIVLSSGQMDSWSARQLGLSEEEYQLVRDHYQQYLEKHRLSGGDSGEEGKSSSADEAEETNSANNNVKYAVHTDDGDDGRPTEDDDNDETEDGDEDEDKIMQETVKILPTDSDSSDSESSISDGESSLSSEESGPSLEELLATAPYVQLVELGLFKGRRCTTGQDFKEICSSIHVQEGLIQMYEEATFMLNDINMPMWNDLRVEVLFTIIGCFLGLVSVLFSIRPCCHHQRVPVYVGSIAFGVSAVLVYVPVVKLLLLRSDFAENLDYDLNITTTLKFSTSLLIACLATPFLIIASFSLIGKEWVRGSRRLYHLITNKTTDKEDTRMEKVPALNEN